MTANTESSLGDSSRVHPARVRWLRSGAPAPGARFVLYWVQINQRARMNAALDFAVEEADALGLPLVVYQGLRPDYPGANDRIHTFILEGAFDLAAGLAEKGIRHLFHLERRPAAASGLLAALARDAALVVTDHYPVFIVPGQARALARQVERPVATVEASCIVPSGFFPRAEYAARTIRPKIHRLLPEHLAPRAEIAPRLSSLGLDVPFPFPAKGLDADEKAWLDLGRGPAPRRGARIADWVASCAIDHSVAPSPTLRGGSSGARARLAFFAGGKLRDYAAAHNDPAVDGTSNLSAYLHFGQISALEVALAALGFGPPGTAEQGRHGAAAAASKQASWAAGRAGERLPAGKRVGAGRADSRSASAARESEQAPLPRRAAAGADRLADPRAVVEALKRALAAPESSTGAFLEQLIVRRELAFNFCEHNPRHASIAGLPDWALRTLDDHAGDPRPRRYDRETLAWSETDDEVWNAAQEELRETGIIHNRVRMLWGKKLLEWSKTPAAAVETMLDFHDRYALDGRDPNTYANVLWCLGLHDRPFGPGRPVLGTIRPMSSEIAKKKFDLSAYLARIRRSGA